VQLGRLEVAKVWRRDLPVASDTSETKGGGGAGALGEGGGVLGGRG